MAEHAGEKETALPHQQGEQEHPATLEQCPEG